MAVPKPRPIFSFKCASNSELRKQIQYQQRADGEELKNRSRLSRFPLQRSKCGKLMRRRDGGSLESTAMRLGRTRSRATNSRDHQQSTESTRRARKTIHSSSRVQIEAEEKKNKWDGVWELRDNAASSREQFHDARELCSLCSALLLPICWRNFNAWPLSFCN